MPCSAASDTGLPSMSVAVNGANVAAPPLPAAPAAGCRGVNIALTAATRAAGSTRASANRRPSASSSSAIAAAESSSPTDVCTARATIAGSG